MYRGTLGLKCLKFQVIKRTDVQRSSPYEKHSYNLRSSTDICETVPNLTTHSETPESDKAFTSDSEKGTSPKKFPTPRLAGMKKKRRAPTSPWVSFSIFKLGRPFYNIMEIREAAITTSLSFSPIFSQR